MSKAVLVVGAGFAGATYARELAEAGYHVDVIDKRSHIGGNAYDEVLPTGVRIHRYGPHLFHTKNARVVDWLRRFGEFVPYEHKVSALTPEDGVLVSLPINRQTINAVFRRDLRNEAEVRAFLAQLAVPCQKPANAAEYLMANIGQVLTELFFRRYTKKMWALDLEELDASVVKRIPIRFDDEDRYFPGDTFQLLPTHGYAAVVRSILDHPNIRVALDVAFAPEMRSSYGFCFNSMPIDEFFGFCFGPLPYRSIRFHHRGEPRTYRLGHTSVVNFTDAGIYTRQTDWSVLPGHVIEDTGRKTITLEEPCDYLDNNMERYYPVKTSNDRFTRLYEKYKALAETEPKLRFIGRCGTYQYLDMDQVINQSLQGVQSWLAAVE